MKALSGALPKGWTWAKVGDIATTIDFGTSAKTTDDPTGVPVLRMGNIVDGRLSLESLRYLPKGHPDLNRLYLEPGDILFNRTNSAELVGKTAVYEGAPKQCSFASYLLRVRLRGLEPKLFSWYLNSIYGRNWVASVVSQQVGQANVNSKKLSNLLVPVPPAGEQVRIVANVEKFLEHLQRTREALRAIKAYEQQAAAHFMSGWPKERLESHLELSREVAGEAWRNFPVVGLSNDGIIIERREPIGAKTATKCRVVHPGDLVFNPIRLSIGSIARYYGKSCALVSPEYVVFRTRNTFSAEVLRRFLRSKEGRRALECETQGSVRYRIYFSQLQDLEVPVAPVDQQVRAESFFRGINNVNSVSDALMSRTRDLESSFFANLFREKPDLANSAA